MASADQPAGTPPVAADAFRPELVERFPAQFEACLALNDYLRSQRPSGPPTNDPAGVLILWTFARSAKTFQGSVRLAGLGYGEQAGMLNRSLYEDMLIAHWIKRHPEEAITNFIEHQRYSLARWGGALRRHGRLPPGSTFPTLSADERKAFRAKFGGNTWTGLNLPALLHDVRAEWESPLERDFLSQINDFVHGFNNLLLHHTAQALSIAGRYDEGENAVTFDVGPSTRHVHGALLGAFFMYANTASLVVSDSKGLARVYGQHLPAFVTIREEPT